MGVNSSPVQIVIVVAHSQSADRAAIADVALQPIEDVPVGCFETIPTFPGTGLGPASRERVSGPRSG